MNKSELITRLNRLATQTQYDPEAQHALAVDALLAYIGDPEIERTYRTVPAL